MSETPTISAIDMVSILRVDNQRQEIRIKNLESQLDEAMSIIEGLLWAAPDYTRDCDCIWCGSVDEARNLMDRRAVAQACDLLERGNE